MDDLISRAAAIDAIVSATIYPDADYIKKLCENPLNNEDWIGGICDAINAVEDVNAVDVAPGRRGRWDLLITEHYGQRWQADANCSCCDFTKYNVWAGFFPDVPPGTAREITRSYAEKVKLPNYCESCGARMLN